MVSRSRISRISTIFGTGAVLALALVQAPVSAQSGAAAAVVSPDRVAVRRLGAGPRIGAMVRDTTDADARRAGLAAPSGAVVATVNADSPASRGGLRADDVITTFDGERIRSAAHLTRVVAETPAGRTVDVEVRREGASQTLRVAPEQLEPRAFDSGALGRPRPLVRVVPAVPEVRRFDDLARVFPEIAGGLPRLGMRVQELNGQLGEYFGAPRGVLVTSVEDGTAAMTAGLRAGDVITGVNGTAVASAADLRRELNGASGSATLTVTRNRTETTVTLAVPERAGPARRVAPTGL